jgi:hypothetical protein
MKIISFIFILYFLTTSQLSAAEKIVAKVLILKGDVVGKTIDGSIVKISVDLDIPEGIEIETAEKSFVKLIFIDKSLMNLGPKSKMVINAFPHSEPGVLTLVKGQLRSQVTKDYMGMDDKSKSKLFIKTTSAAMGIRGTDFQVNYNEENHNTSLITFEGAVAMAHIDHEEKNSIFDQHQLEHIVSSEKAVMVKSGQISAVNLNISEVAMIPTKLAASQIEALKENETGLKTTDDSERVKNVKQFKSPIPPGIDGAILNNSQQGENKTEVNNANGFFNQKTGEYKLPAGSIIDLNTVNIIPPPVNAVFDPNLKMFIIPTALGRIDFNSGDYKAPEGLKLGNDGKFQTATIVTNDRGPAAESISPAKIPIVPSLYDSRPDMVQFTDKFANINPIGSVVLNDQLRNIANDRLIATDVIKNNIVNSGTNLPTSNVKFIFNVAP